MSESPLMPAGRGPDSSARAGGAEGAGYCVFQVSGHRCALPASVVLEVALAHKLLPVPLTPPWMLGLHNLRGRPLGVVDLETLTGSTLVRSSLDPAEIGLLVLKVDGAQFAVRVDRVEGFVAAADARLAGVVGEGLEASAVRGVLALAGGEAATLLCEQEIVSRVRTIGNGRPALPVAATA